MSETHEELGIISGVGFGMRDAPWPILWFSVDLLLGSIGVHLSVDEAAKLIKKHHIYEIKDLEGKPCIMECEGRKASFKELKK